MATDLGFSLLLPDSTMDNSDGDGDHWAQLSSLWDGAEAGLKQYPDLMDFGQLPMEMDFNPALGMEPGALHYDLNPLQFSYDDPAAFHSISPDIPQFAFSFQPAVNASSTSFTSSTPSLSPPESPNKERRLSVASSSSSTVSLLASPYTNDSASVTVKVESKPEVTRDAASEIAERVRQTAGVMLAVPMTTDLSTQALAHSIAMAESKASIPRSAPRSPISSSSSAASTPPPSTPPMSSTIPNKLVINPKPISHSPSTTPISPLPPLATPTSASGARPKTSHTTIERRYRTNLNARIQSLRLAVPALRVLEDRDGGNGKKIKKNLKDGVYLKGAGIGIDTGEGGAVDVIDERGFVDGVKVARKCSKANVLGKAVEYIRVLKKREGRLRAEQDGLKALVGGLVGGPALLKEWELRWRERFGGEEKDEVEGDEAVDDESDDEEGDEDEDTAGRKRKRAKPSAPPVRKPVEKKLTAAPASTRSVISELTGQPLGGAPAPEKRKRGRPRKVVPPPMPVATLAPHMSHQQAAAMHLQQQAQQQQRASQDHTMLPPDGQHQGQAPQYMLAVFALFSFFNSPLTARFASSAGGGGAAHGHSGMVFSSPPLALAPEVLSQLVRPASPAESAAQGVAAVSWAWREYLQVLHLVVSVVVVGSFLWSWVGVRGAWGSGKKKGVAEGGRKSQELQDKRGVGEVCDEFVLRDRTSPAPSALTLLRIYYALSSPRTAPISQLVSLALLLYTTRGPFGALYRLKSHAVWARAQRQARLLHTPRSTRPAATPLEVLVMEGYTLCGAASALSRASLHDKPASAETEEEGVGMTPLGLLGARLVKERVKRHLGRLFVEAVGVARDGVDFEREGVRGGRERDVMSVNGGGREAREEIGRTVEAASELGGAVEELGRVMERVGRAGVLLDVGFGLDYPDAGLSEEKQEREVGEEQEREEEGAESPFGEGLDGEIRALLTAVVLYKRMFCGTNTPTVSSLLISPPPSPATRGVKGQGQEEAQMLALRKALGSRVFEDGEGAGVLEDARDKVVDLIFDTDRRGRCGGLC